MVGVVNDAMARGMPPPDVKKWSVDQARQRERQTRGQRNTQRGPMQFTETTRLLLAHGADVNAATDEGLTPLHLAAQSMNAELVSLLIAAKADVNAVHRPRAFGPRTPIIYAAQYGDIDVVHVLLNAGVDPAKVPTESRGYFANMAMSNIDVFRLLLDRGMVLPPQALKIATRLGRTEAVEEILRRQKSPKATDLDAALYAAATDDSTDVRADAEQRMLQTVSRLLDAGASPSAPNGTGEALVAAIVNDRPAVAKLLKDRGAKVDWSRLTDKQHHPAFLAYASALEGRLDRLRELEALGMPLDPMGAALLGRADRLRQLIADQKDLVAGERGATALYFAAANGHAECVRVLLDARADPNARMPSWDTPDIGPRPLAGAAIGGHADVVRLLLDRGADPKLLELDDDERAKLTPEIRALLGLK